VREAFGVRRWAGPMFAERIDPGPPKSRAIGAVPYLAGFSYRSRSRRARNRALTVAGGRDSDGRTDMNAGRRRVIFGVTPGIDNEARERERFSGPMGDYFS
jgi:hypothetical protein